MAETTSQRLRGLVLDATEIKSLTQWPPEMVEDYLNLIDNLILLSDEIDTKNNILKETTRVTTSPYQILSTDEEIFFDTTLLPITALLPEGIDGTNYRMINVGKVHNDVTLTPSGTELLFGENATERIADEEVLIATYETDEGWY